MANLYVFTTCTTGSGRDSNEVYVEVCVIEDAEGCNIRPSAANSTQLN